MHSWTVRGSSPAVVIVRRETVVVWRSLAGGLLR